MASNPSRIEMNEVWAQKDGGELSFSHTAVVAFEGYDAYHGNLSERETNINKETIISSLSPIPKDDIYPTFSPSLTRAPEIYTKVPNLSLYPVCLKGEIASRLRHEAEIYEKFKKAPHPSLGKYLGCVVNEGRITGLALVKYRETLLDRIENPSFQEEERARCMDQVEDAVKHIHSLGLAHNDLGPLNIMFDDEGLAVIVDFDTCYPIGTRLTKGGHVGDWRGIPMESFEKSSVECDNRALEHVREWLGQENMDRVTSEVAQGTENSGAATQM